LTFKVPNLLDFVAIITVLCSLDMQFNKHSMAYLRGRINELLLYSTVTTYVLAK